MAEDQERALGSHTPRTDEAKESLRAQEKAFGERPAPEAGRQRDEAAESAESE